MRRGPGKWALLGALFVVLVLADQATKYLAVERLTRVFERAPGLALRERVRAFYTYRHLEPLATEPYYVWKPVWRMNYVENPGAAWGLFRGLSDGIRETFFKIVSLARAASAFDPGWRTSIATPTTMSESATLKVGQRRSSRFHQYHSTKSTT